MEAQEIFEQSDEPTRPHIDQVINQINALTIHPPPPTQLLRRPPPPKLPKALTEPRGGGSNRKIDGHGQLANYARKQRQDLRRAVGDETYRCFERKFLENEGGEGKVAKNSQLMVLFCLEFIHQVRPELYGQYTAGIEAYLRQWVDEARLRGGEEGEVVVFKTEILLRLMRVAKEHYDEGRTTQREYLQRLMAEGEGLFKCRQKNKLRSELEKLRRHIQVQEIGRYLAPTCIPAIQALNE